MTRSSGPRRVPRAVQALAGLALGATLAGAGAPAAAAASAPAGPEIYTCVDDHGRRLTSDRPIAECKSKDQRVLNSDGSLRRIQRPVPTAEERVEQEAAERRAAQERAALADAVRRDRNLLARYPDEAAHRKAREAALDTVRLAMKATEKRLAELAAERTPLNSEAEFYKGRTMPTRLKQAIDANDAGFEAQRNAAANQEAELGRINKLYDTELERLRKLWAGAAPGSLGAAPKAEPVSPGASSAAR